MAWYERDRTAAAVLGGGLALLAAVAVVTAGPVACPAVGIANISPIRLAFDPGLGVDAVDACFGAGCAPVPVAPGAGGDWSVPQSGAHLQDVEPGDVTAITLRAWAAGAVVADGVFVVERELDGFGWWGQCPGMRGWDYLPVEVG